MILSSHLIHLLNLGRHYWYNISANMDCNDFYPMFLLYNRDRLTGFGWVAQGNADSSRYEHPPPNRLKVSQVQKRNSIQLYTDEFLTPCTLWRYCSWVARNS